MNRQQIEKRPAFMFMVDAHNSINQRRKYTGEPYWTHPLAVAEILAYNCPWATPEMIDAALLHDVPEDVGQPESNPENWHNYTIEAVTDRFGPKTGILVDGLTERVYNGLNRAQRKALEVKRLANTCERVQTIKVCDLLHNTGDIAHADEGFARVYMPEKRHLLDHGLRNAYPPLWKKADKYVRSYFARKKVLDSA